MNPESIDTLRSLGEFGLIERLSRSLPVQSEEIKVGIGDDTAVFAFGDRTLLATTDALLEGVHFRTDWTSPEDLGWKSLAVSLSDIAAMGGTPKFALISLGLPPNAPVSWIERFYRGMASLSSEANCPVLGGDTITSPDRIYVNLTVIGEAPDGRYSLRSGAKPGDALIVTGTLGDSLSGYHCLKESIRVDNAVRHCLNAHRKPMPRLKEGGIALESPHLHAMMDLSDGLSGDVRHLMEKSGVGVVIEESRLPISAEMREVAARLGKEPIEIAIQGGEDYELLMAVSQDGVSDFLTALSERGDAKATVIGEVTERDGEVTERDGEATLVRSDGTRIPMPRLSWDHFK